MCKFHLGPYQLDMKAFSSREKYPGRKEWRKRRTVLHALLSNCKGRAVSPWPATQAGNLIISWEGTDPTSEPMKPSDARRA